MINRVLILEDNKERIVQFRKNLNGLNVVVDEHAVDAIQHLQNEDWDVLFLDHDLGDAVCVSTNNKDTGSEVARWLESNPTRKPRIIIIHSLNVVGQKYMKGILLNAVIFPFAWANITSSNLIEENVELLQKLSDSQLMQLLGG
jgi:CheY-like chemotaxis protein